MYFFGNAIHPNKSTPIPSIASEALGPAFVENCRIEGFETKILESRFQPIDRRASLSISGSKVVLSPVKSPVIVPILVSEYLGLVALKKLRAVNNSLNNSWSVLVREPEAIPCLTRLHINFTWIGKIIGRPAKEVKERFPRWILTHV